MDQKGILEAQIADKVIAIASEFISQEPRSNWSMTLTSWNYGLFMMVIVCAIGLVFALFITYFVDQLVQDHTFYPVKSKNLNQTKEDVFLRSRKKKWLRSPHPKLHVVYLPAGGDTTPSSSTSPNKNLLIYFHGNACNLTQSRAFMVWMRQKFGVSVLGMDYRGYGHSEGNPHDSFLVQDADLLWEYATSRLGFSPSDIILYGCSLGSVPSTYLAGKHPNLGGLVLEAGFSHGFDLIPVDWLRNTIKFFLPRTKLTPATYLKRSKCPVLIVHGDLDSVVPLSQAHLMLEIAKERKGENLWEFLLIENQGHSLRLDADERYLDALSRMTCSHRK